MVECEELFEIFRRKGFSFFSGVPDSTFKYWMKFLVDEKRLTNIIAANECEATAICSGYHLATGKIGVVYMQNSGEGKTINPLASLCDPEVYSIPVLLMIGWRGEPGKPDEPQHKKMGRITMPLLDTLEIPYSILEDDPKKIERVLKNAREYMTENNSPVAIIIKKGLVSEYKQKTKTEQDYEMSREDAIEAIMDNLSGNEIIISTTGKTSRELFEYRENKSQSHKNDFYTVGSMGCASSIALGIALEQRKRKVFVFDGDGAALMQLGTVSTIGHYKPENLIHLIFNNEAYDSTGGQPTVSPGVDFGGIATACGYNSVNKAETREELAEIIRKISASKGPCMVITNVKRGSRKDLGRPTTTPIENKQDFMKTLSEELQNHE